MTTSTSSRATSATPSISRTASKIVRIGPCYRPVRAVGRRLRQMPEISLQRQYAPTSRCFGCGPANVEGLRIESHDRTDMAAEPAEPAEPGELIAEWQPLPHHAAFDNVLNGG